MNTLLVIVLCIALLITSYSANNKMHQLILSDPFHIIFDFLSHTEQRVIRLTNRRFNYLHNATHFETIQNIQHFTDYATQIIVNNIIKNESIIKLKSINQKLKFNEYYLKKWPTILADCLMHSPSMDNFIFFMNITSNINIWHNSSNFLLYKSWKGIIGLLLLQSHIIFKAIFFGEQKHFEFDLFLYETMWVYTSLRDSSFKLPPIESIFYMDVNADLYETQISNLNYLRKEYGLIIWDPLLLNVRWNANDFFENVNAFMEFIKAFNDCICNEFEAEFVPYLKVSFCLKILEQNDFDFGQFVDLQNYLFDYFELTIRESVRYLWLKQYFSVLDDFLCVLHENNALSMLYSNDYLMKLNIDSKVNETFIGILVELYHFDNHRLNFSICCALAKSIFFWFVEKDKNNAMNVMFAMNNRRFLCKQILDLLVSFLQTSIFHFVSDESKRKYFKILLDGKKMTATD